MRSQYTRHLTRETWLNERNVGTQLCELSAKTFQTVNTRIDSRIRVIGILDSYDLTIVATVRSEDYLGKETRILFEKRSIEILDSK